ncbi:MAG: amidohydrolase family protein [Acidobacteriota bacterium]
MNPSSVLICNGTLYDGCGGPPRRGDLLVEDGRIVAVGEAKAAGGAGRILDAEGLAVCPGFIDIHSHSDLALLHREAPDLLGPFIAQGITTQVIGNCGLGVAPAPPAQRSTLAAFMALIAPAGVEWTWSSYQQYLSALKHARPPLNVVPLVAHGALRCAVLGATPGPARGRHLEAMATELEAALRAGAFGLSAGLIYPPGLWADTEELARLCRMVAAVDGLFACHVRGSSEVALEAERELLTLGERTGVRLQHSHHEAFGAPYWHLARSTLAMEDEARGQGIDIASDVIPYHAVNTSLLAVYPPWALAGGVEELCGRLARPAERDRIGLEIAGRIPHWPPWEDGWAHNLVRATGWENIVLLQAASPAHTGWLGKSFTAIGEGEGKPPFLCAAEITRAAKGNVMARYHGVAGAPGDDGVLGDLLRHPQHAIGVDVILKGDGVPHPGGYGAMPRVLGHYARQRGWFSLQEAIRKATSLPASRLGLADRGRLAPGSMADLVIFDGQSICERGSYEAPRRRPQGIHWVLINGEVALESGELTGRRCGSVLHRPLP